MMFIEISIILDLTSREKAIWLELYQSSWKVLVLSDWPTKIDSLSVRRDWGYSCWWEWGWGSDKENEQEEQTEPVNVVEQTDEEDSESESEMSSSECEWGGNL